MFVCRGFMFGQPSLCHIHPRDSLPLTALTSLICDVFVHNCDVSDTSHGCGVVFPLKTLSLVSVVFV